MTKREWLDIHEDESSQKEYEKHICQKILDVANYISKYAIRKNPNIGYVKVDEQTWRDMCCNMFTHNPLIY